MPCDLPQAWTPQAWTRAGGVDRAQDHAKPGDTRWPSNQPGPFQGRRCTEALWGPRLEALADITPISIADHTRHETMHDIARSMAIGAGAWPTLPDTGCRRRSTGAARPQ